MTDEMMNSPHTSPTDTRIRPLVALRAIRALFKNKEDTGQVFKVVEALKGDSMQRNLAQFRETAVAQEILAENRRLIDTLCDTEYLRNLPEGSLGRAYQAFLDEENLSAEGLVAASEEAPYTRKDDADMALFSARMRDSHDLHHVTFGYGRNPLGELCTLTFGYPHTRNRGIGVLVLFGLFKFKKDMRGVPVLRTAWEAYRNGRKAVWTPGIDWEAMLKLPLDEVRATLKIATPTRYNALEKCLKCKESEYQKAHAEGMPQAA